MTATPPDITAHHDLAPDPSSVRELLVLRPGGLGDVVRAVPALRHLRRTFPDARISVVADAPGRALLDTCPYVDRTIAHERPSEARIERFDLAMSFAAPATRTRLELDDVRARVRARWRHEETARDRSTVHPRWPERLDDRSRMLRMAWLLGGELNGDAALGLWPSLAQRNAAAEMVADSGRPLAIVHPGAGTTQRRWPVAHWARVLDMLEGAGLDPVLIGAGDEQTLADDIIAAARYAPISLVGATSVGELVGLLERATIFIGSDSGPAALAGAVGVRSIIIGPASRYEHEPRPGLVDIVCAGPCAACGELACGHQAPDAADVPLEAVLARLEVAATTAAARWRASRIA